MPRRDFRDMYRGQAPHQAHSDTSTSAAAALAEERRNTLRAAVLAHITASAKHGATDEEMQVALEMDGNTERPRRRELQLGGLIVDSGRRRPTEKNRQAVVWVTAPLKQAVAVLPSAPEPEPARREPPPVAADPVPLTRKSSAKRKESIDGTRGRGSDVWNCRACIEQFFGGPRCYAHNPTPEMREANPTRYKPTVTSWLADPESPVECYTCGWVGVARETKTEQRGRNFSAKCPRCKQHVKMLERA